MRLAPKRRAEWLEHREFGQGIPERVETSSGPSEVFRLGEGDPIVLVPGLAGGRRLVVPLARSLARRYEVILFDHRGDRTATQPGPSRMSDYAADLAELIATLRLERPTVLGVSFGGAVALEMAVESPGLVGALILHGVEARFRPSLGSKIARRVLERFPLPSDNGFVNQFFNLLHGGRPNPGPLPEFVVRRCWETDQNVMASRLGVLESFDVSDRLWRLDVPTLVLAGMRDVVVPADRQRALAASIPGARYAALDGAGHIGFLTHRDEFVRRVRRMLRVRADARP